MSLRRIKSDCDANIKHKGTFDSKPRTLWFLDRTLFENAQQRRPAGTNASAVTGPFFLSKKQKSHNQIIFHKNNVLSPPEDSPSAQYVRLSTPSQHILAAILSTPLGRSLCQLQGQIKIVSGQMCRNKIFGVK